MHSELGARNGNIDSRHRFHEPMPIIFALSIWIADERLLFLSYLWLLLYQPRCYPYPSLYMSISFTISYQAKYIRINSYFFLNTYSYIHRFPRIHPHTFMHSLTLIGWSCIRSKTAVSCALLWSISSVEVSDPFWLIYICDEWMRVFELEMSMHKYLPTHFGGDSLLSLLRIPCGEDLPVPAIRALHFSHGVDRCIMIMQMIDKD